MTDLTFTPNMGGYFCKLADNQLTGVIQIVLGAPSAIVAVAANLPGMPPSTVGTFSNPYGESVIFAVDFPQGMEVTLTTSNEPERAAWKESE